MKSSPENSVLAPRRMNTPVIRCAGLILGFLLARIVAHALDPNRKISEHAHSVWRIQDGFFPSFPMATRLWIILVVQMASPVIGLWLCLRIARGISG